MAIWALWHWRARAIGPLVLWGVVGLAVFFLFWPWLWPDPFHRFLEYADGTTQRAVLYVWYFGRRYADREVPWHYALVTFFVTVPIGLHALGVLGLLKGPSPPWKERHGQLVFGALLFPLVLFSVPHVAVYDGARLFLVVFPLWAILVGRGGKISLSWLREKLPARAAIGVAACLLAAQGWGLMAEWPCFLSYYNLGVGGPYGANRLGLEVDYWGEAVTHDLLEQVVRTVPDGARVETLRPYTSQGLPARRTCQSIPRFSRAGNSLDRLLGRRHAARRVSTSSFERMADLSPPLQERIAQNRR